MKEPKWILNHVVYSIHSEQIATHGGADGICDKRLLESALDAPRQLFHYEQASICQLAETYAYRIIHNHPFVDGNKRTGYIVSRLFLMLNGYDINSSEEECITVILAVAGNDMSEEALIQWFEKTSSKVVSA